jgi:hypothetical protein
MQQQNNEDLGSLPSSISPLDVLTEVASSRKQLPSSPPPSSSSSSPSSSSSSSSATAATPPLVPSAPFSIPTTYPTPTTPTATWSDLIAYQQMYLLHQLQQEELVRYQQALAQAQVQALAQPSLHMYLRTLSTELAQAQFCLPNSAKYPPPRGLPKEHMSSGPNRNLTETNSNNLNNYNLDTSSSSSSDDHPGRLNLSFILNQSNKEDERPGEAVSPNLKRKREEDTVQTLTGTTTATPESVVGSPTASSASTSSSTSTSPDEGKQASTSSGLKDEPEGKRTRVDLPNHTRIPPPSSFSSATSPTTSLLSAPSFPIHSMSSAAASALSGTVHPAAAAAACIYPQTVGNLFVPPMMMGSNPSTSSCGPSMSLAVMPPGSLHPFHNLAELAQLYAAAAAATASTDAHAQMAHPHLAASTGAPFGTNSHPYHHNPLLSQVQIPQPIIPCTPIIPATHGFVSSSLSSPSSSSSPSPSFSISSSAFSRPAPSTTRSPVKASSNNREQAAAGSHDQHHSSIPQKGSSSSSSGRISPPSSSVAATAAAVKQLSIPSEPLQKLQLMQLQQKQQQKLIQRLADPMLFHQLKLPVQIAASSQTDLGSVGGGSGAPGGAVGGVGTTSIDTSADNELFTLRAVEKILDQDDEFEHRELLGLKQLGLPQHDTHPKLKHHHHVKDNGATTSTTSALGKQRRRRATPKQLRVLEKVFALEPFPNAQLKKLLSDRLDMTVKSVTIWFQNKRARLKKVDTGSSEEGDEETSTSNDNSNSNAAVNIRTSTKGNRNKGKESLSSSSMHEVEEAQRQSSSNGGGGKVDKFAFHHLLVLNGGGLEILTE